MCIAITESNVLGLNCLLHFGHINSTFVKYKKQINTNIKMKIINATKTIHQFSGVLAVSSDENTKQVMPKIINIDAKT